MDNIETVDEGEERQMDWLNAGFLIPVVVVTVAGIVFGRIRGETPVTIGLNVGGYLIFLFGLNWAASLDIKALLAAGAANLGSLVFTMAAGRQRREAIARR